RVGPQAPHAHELREVEAGAIIERRAPVHARAIGALEVTLLADRLAERGGLEAGRGDDRPGPAARRTPDPPPDVGLAPAAATLAADRQPVEDRGTRLDPLDAVGVAEQALERDPAVEMEVVDAVVGGQVPAPTLGVPGDRGLVELPLPLGQERVTPG